MKGLPPNGDASTNPIQSIPNTETTCYLRIIEPLTTPHLKPVGDRKTAAHESLSAKLDLDALVAAFHHGDILEYSPTQLMQSAIDELSQQKRGEINKEHLGIIIEKAVIAVFLHYHMIDVAIFLPDTQPLIFTCHLYLEFYKKLEALFPLIDSRKKGKKKTPAYLKIPGLNREKASLLRKLTQPLTFHAYKTDAEKILNVFYKTGKQIFKSNIKEAIIAFKKDSNYYHFNKQKNTFQLNFHFEENLSIEKKVQTISSLNFLVEYGINGESFDKILHTIDRINLHGIRIKFHDIALSRNSTTAKFYSRALEKLWGPLMSLEDTEYNLSSNTIYDLEQGNILSAIERLKKYFETHTFEDIKNYEDTCFLLGYIYTHIEINLEYAIYYINPIDDRIYKNMILGNIYYLQEKFTQAIEAFENSDFNHTSTIGFSSESRKRLMECYFEAHKYKNIRALFRKEIKALIENPLQKFNFSGKQYYILWYALKDQPNYESDQFYFLMNSKMKNYAPASYAYGQKFEKEGKIDKAIENYKDSSNYLPSMMALARIYSSEEKYDEKLWFANLHHAHKKGHADATYQLALYIKNIKKNKDQYIKLLKIAADHNHEKAIYEYASHKDTGRNEKIGILEFAHKKGYKDSANLLGKHYEKEGLYKAALTWYLRYSPEHPKTIELRQKILDLRAKEREAILSENHSVAPPSIEEKGTYHPPALTKKQARLLNIPKASIHPLSPTFEEEKILTYQDVEIFILSNIEKKLTPEMNIWLRDHITSLANGETRAKFKFLTGDLKEFCSMKIDKKNRFIFKITSGSIETGVKAIEIHTISEHYKPNNGYKLVPIKLKNGGEG